MNCKKDINSLHEQKIIIHCIMQGMSLKQISKKLNCAKSTASYKTRKLFEEYSASDRYEFIVNIFTKLIIRYKNKLSELEEELKKYTK